MSVSRELYEATAASHKALEKTAFAQRLATGQFGLTAYVDYLRAVAVVVTNLRTAVGRNGTREQRFMLPTLNEWVTHIGADIKTLAPDDPLINPDAQAAAHKLTQKLFRTIVDDPAWSFGLAYVMFGSHNGNRSIVKAISAGLGLEGNTGTTYMRATQPGNPVWSRFKEVLDASIDNSDSLESAQRGAIATFD
ncbi:MAG: biliverdin-producing heme oxygenase [Lysobacterales bacterium]